MDTKLHVRKRRKTETEAGRKEVLTHPAVKPVRKPGTPAKWMTHPELWTKEEFLLEVEEVVHMVHGDGALYDLNTASALADQMEKYVRAYDALRTEPHILTARNGVTMINQNIKIADAALTKIIKLNQELGIDLKSRKPRPKSIDDLDDLLAGPQL